MNVQELKRGYDELPEADQVLFATLIAADQMARQGEFATDISRLHQAMDEGRKWSHEDMLRLDGELRSRGL